VQIATPDAAQNATAHQLFPDGRCRLKEKGLATLPQFEPVRSAAGLSTPHPSRNPKGFRNAFLTRLRRRNCAPPPSQHRFARVMPMAILLRRSFIRYRPSASRSGRGVAEESPTRLRPASRTHDPRQQKLSRIVLPFACLTVDSHCSASGNNWGGFAQAALL